MKAPVARLRGSVRQHDDRAEPLGSYAALARATTGGNTALFRALSAALLPFSDAAHGRKVMLLVSDGNDNEEAPIAVTTTWSLLQRSRASQAIRRSGVALYAIGIGMGQEPVNHQLLGDLAEPTGGYVEVVGNASLLEAAVARVADDLRAQYTLAFEPAQLDGKFHDIAVKSRSSDHRIRARSGYFAGK